MNPQGYDKADEKYFNSMETVTRWASTAASPLSNTPASADRKVKRSKIEEEVPQKICVKNLEVLKCP
ncbi:hypothetical protein EB796_016573 [Bugula neritina]|uniref:Uncharacterized protein n=1 Tax=Bugula neritina TaxID=10212 RepID=A0A7J7JHP2_BUGNE|nr:hypothetical protein EB796_016573 [Bugula neritina]